MVTDNISRDDKTESLGFDTISKLISQTLDQNELASRCIGKANASERLTQKTITGIPSGFNEIDLCTSGFQKGEFSIIAARPGMGRTAFLLSMANNIALRNKKAIALFSLERNSKQLVNRWIESETGMPVEKIKKGTFCSEEVEMIQLKLNKLSEAQIYIDDSHFQSIEKLTKKCKSLVKKKAIDIVLVDYLQLLATENTTENDIVDLEIIAQSLKALAEQLNVPVVAFSSVGRIAETRGHNKKPHLNDITGNLEKYADTVMFIYRPEYYLIHEDDDGKSLKGTAQIIIAKHISSECKMVNLRFIEKYSSFENLN